MPHADPAADRPLRLLQVSAFFPAHGGGIEAVAAQLARRLSAAGLHVHWMAGGPPDEWPSALSDGNLTITPVRSWDPLERRLGLPMPVWSPGSLAALWRAVGRADVVHVHDYLYLPTLAAALMAWLRRKPLIVTQHVGEIPFGSRISRLLLATLNRTVGAALLRRADQAVFVGQPVLRHFESFTRFAATPRLIPNGVDATRYMPAPRPQRPVVELLFVGRFVEKKGVRLLRRCLDLAGVHWTFVGWGPETPVDTPRDGVRLPGRLPPEAIVPHYQQADLLVLPSTGEGFPLVVQEALACGTPVLVSREVADAFPSIDPRCVFDVELRTDDPAAALRRALASLLSEPARLAQAREHAAALAGQWSWERCIGAYRSVYDRVLAGRHRSTRATAIDDSAPRR